MHLPELKSQPNTKSEINQINPMPQSESGLLDVENTRFPQNPPAGKGQIWSSLPRKVTLALLRHIKTGFLAALKIINKLDLLGTGTDNDKSMNQLLSEIKIQRFLDHPNLIKLYDFFAD